MNEDTEGTGIWKASLPFPVSTGAPGQGGTPQPSKAAAERQCHGLRDRPGCMQGTSCGPSRRGARGEQVEGPSTGGCSQSASGVLAQRVCGASVLGSHLGSWRLHTVDLHRVGRKGVGRPFCGPPLHDISAWHLCGEMSRWHGRDSLSLTRPHARYLPWY